MTVLEEVDEQGLGGGVAVEREVRFSFDLIRERDLPDEGDVAARVAQGQDEDNGPQGDPRADLEGGVRQRHPGNDQRAAEEQDERQHRQDDERQPERDFWVAKWMVPDDAPMGIVRYTVTAKDPQGRTGEFKPFEVQASQITIVP